MKSKFNLIYEELMQSLNTVRKSIKKVNQMTDQQFLSFLRDIIPLIKDGSLDLTRVKITEKVDRKRLQTHLD